MKKGVDAIVKRKAQISMEYLSIAGFAFLMTMPLIIVFYTQLADFNTDVSYTQMDRIAEEIVNAADSVYYMGPPSQITLKMYFPKNIKNIAFLDHYVYVNVSVNGGIRPLNVEKYRSMGNLTGTLPVHPGIHYIQIQANAENISISEK
jgi:hypothetical protein